MILLWILLRHLLYHIKLYNKHMILFIRLLRESGRATHFPTYVVGAFSGNKLLSEGLEVI